VQAIIKLAIRFRFKLPAYYTLIVRSLCSLEGVALRIDPDYSIVNAAIPIILRRMLTDTRPAAVNLLRELLLDNNKQLRLGMLEGLLKNYSVDTGKGSASESPASGVVLQLDGINMSDSNSAMRNGVAAVVSSGNGSSAHARGLNGNGRGPAVHAEKEPLLQNGRHPSRARGDSSQGARGREESVRGNGVVRVPSRVRRGHGTPDSGGTAVLPSPHETEVQQQVQERGASVVVANRNGADLHERVSEVKELQSHPVSEAAPDVQEPEATSFEGIVLQMILSARASGVRRVVLESDMKVLP
jgi:hypothetical protein